MAPAKSLLMIVVLLGCSQKPTTTESDLRRDVTVNAAQDSTAAERQDLAELRSATARFQRFEEAQSAGWNTQFPAGCFSSNEGGMGLHFQNTTIAGPLSVTEPQLLLYEPEKNGTMKFVAVEYIVPGLPSDPAPRLFRREFKYNTTFHVWALHVWAWQENPKGIYADWNPRVTCTFAPSVAAGSHH